MDTGNSSSTDSTVTLAENSNDEQPLAAVYVGQWNRLVSTTNWEKGRIICQWREALVTAGAPVTDYSDEAWAQLVGGVTSQHVGRLRRVFQRFGDDFDQYPGLYWSHFQAALDWDDAPMWLEGAIQNEWSVSQMRGKRWETLGTPVSDQHAELARDAAPEEPAEVALVTAPEPEETDTSVSARTADVKPVGSDGSTPDRRNDGDDGDAEAPFDDEVAAQPAPKRTRLNVDVELLPDDLADAFEQFKLAIIAQRREGWRDINRETVIECLDALKELALAEA